MLSVCYSPKGGQGCTTVTAALALAQRRSLIDTTGDLPAVLGLPETSGPGICDPLADDQTLEVAAIERLANPNPTMLVSAGPRPRPACPSIGGPSSPPPSLPTGVAWFLDAGTNPAAGSLTADRKLLVVRNCYLALRRRRRPPRTTRRCRARH